MKGSMKGWAKRYANQYERADKLTGGVTVAGKLARSSGGVRSSKNAGQCVPPRGHVPVVQNFTEKYALQKTIVRYDVASTQGGPPGDAIPVFVYTPSNRLILTIQAFFEPDDMGNADIALATPPTWTITRMAVNSISGRESAMSQFYPDPGSAAVDLPDEVIIPDAPELLRLNLDDILITQFDPSLGGTNINLIIQAKWEPDVQTIPRDELKRLYERCRIAYGAPLEILNAPIP